MRSGKEGEREKKTGTVLDTKTFCYPRKYMCTGTALLYTHFISNNSILCSQNRKNPQFITNTVVLKNHGVAADGSTGDVEPTPQPYNINRA